MKQNKRNLSRLHVAGLILVLLAMLLCAGCEKETVELPSGSPLVPTPSQSTNGGESGAPSSATPAPTPEQSTTPATPEPEPVPEPTVATLAVCGDMMSHMPIIQDAWVSETETYDFYRMMAAAEPYVSTADYAVVNFETNMAGGPNYSGYPAFNAPDAMAYDLKKLGFDLCLTSNNHSLDRGFSGLCRTLDVMDQVGLEHVGTSRTQEEYDENWVIADVGGISVAFLGYSYGTNAIPLPTSAPFAVNLFNTDYMTTLSTPDYDKMESDLEKVKALETDMVAVMIHWGWEYQTKQSDYQDEMADFLIAHGVDMVLGGHSHVPQPMELRSVYDGQGNEHTGFVCFSLGNFISSQNYVLTDTTAVLTLELTRDNVTNESSVTAYSYVPMYMLDREEGAFPRFELLDARAALEDESTGADLKARIEKAISDCHRIYGEAYDSLAPVKAEVKKDDSGPGTANDLTLNYHEFTISDKWPNPVPLRAKNANGKVTWVSSDPEVATVSSTGVVRRVGIGKCTVTATDEAGDTDTCIVWCRN